MQNRLSERGVRHRGLTAAFVGRERFACGDQPFDLFETESIEAGGFDEVGSWDADGG
ncbi:hypothetical protein ACH4PU_31105 [Streptomyces sp. NPDC021100]|uniref:hypothetical protein n=1 Tax=Streptomyces sp. NPDC021100 TaxID=3365114 RepID=UPI0037B6CF7C